MWPTGERGAVELPLFDGESRGPEGDRRSMRGPLPVIGEQSDIRYLAATARSVLNSPAATGMGFWSINPYIGCAFGCAYCYARYAHRYTNERLTASGSGFAAPSDRARDEAVLPPWLAFERRIMVKGDAARLLRRALMSQARVDGIKRDGVVIGTATAINPPSGGSVSPATCSTSSPNIVDCASRSSPRARSSRAISTCSLGSRSVRASACTCR